MDVGAKGDGHQDDSEFVRQRTSLNLSRPVITRGRNIGGCRDVGRVSSCFVRCSLGVLIASVCFCTYVSVLYIIYDICI